jgi:hypothetical protein
MSPESAQAFGKEPIDSLDNRLAAKTMRAVSKISQCMQGRVGRLKVIEETAFDEL